ncbi:MAG: LysM domain-containing protein [Acidimicrobiaceae bacterium]|nr:LysM domain-containing protein [Acidimicrobiaceae bacterium]MDE0517028.1 LysM domain-containing protein [Acidimicrobiaceae bacterium]MDE0655105.1 LysM domain-containing protein [Acidimicrobiaceae bacterium]
MEAACPPALTLVPADVSAVPAFPPPRSVRLPESVYRRRRVVAAVIAAAVLTLAVVAARPDRVPPGEANPWPSTGEVTIPAQLPGVYIVKPGDTLWDIAVAIAPGTDPRGLVHELADAVGGAALEPGQQIFLDAAGDSPVVIGPRQQPGQPDDAVAAAPSAT